MNRDKVLGGLFGHGIGDALGVPVEFKSRDWLSSNPVMDYMGYMCWNQPPGTFSDDSSMMYCTVESLIDGFDINTISEKFVKWYKDGYWGAHDELFDIGGTTRRSLERIFLGESPKISGDMFPENNGNGSLMRILPFVYFLLNENDINMRYQIIKDVSSITHAHFRSVFSCFIFVEFGRLLLLKKSREEAYIEMKKSISQFANENEFSKLELDMFNRILELNISEILIDDINSTGYVLDSLECALHCFLTTKSFKDSVLKSVNLGGDTDTIGAINGGLAGLYYGLENIPNKWIIELAKSNKIELLGNSFIDRLNKL